VNPNLLNWFLVLSTQLKIPNREYNSHDAAHVNLIHLKHLKEIKFIKINTRTNTTNNKQQRTSYIYLLKINQNHKNLYIKKYSKIIRTNKENSISPKDPILFYMKKIQSIKVNHLNEYKNKEINILFF
jgi:hypothetical protein